MTEGSTNEGTGTTSIVVPNAPMLPGLQQPGQQNGPSPNPMWPSAITVSVPESITIRMVDASALGDYEIWVFIASVLSNAVVGFLIAWLQARDSHSPSEKAWEFSFFIFVILFIISAIRAVTKRISLQRKSKTIPLQVSQVGTPISGVTQTS